MFKNIYDDEMKELSSKLMELQATMRKKMEDLKAKQQMYSQNMKKYNQKKKDGSRSENESLNGKDSAEHSSRSEPQFQKISSSRNGHGHSSNFQNARLMRPSSSRSRSNESP